MAKPKFSKSSDPSGQRENIERTTPPPGDDANKATNDALSKLTEAIVGLNKEIKSLKTQVSENNKHVKESKSSKPAQSSAKDEEDKKYTKSQLNAILNQLRRTESNLDNMKGLGFFDRSTRKQLKSRVGDLKKQVKDEKTLDEDAYQDLIYDIGDLKDRSYKSKNGLFGTLKNTMETSPKTKGMMSIGLGLATGINPVLLQVLGLDKAAKWAGGKALNGLSNLAGKALDGVSNLFHRKKSDEEENQEDTPNDLVDGAKKKVSKKKKKANGDADNEDGVPNGTGELEDKKGGLLSTIGDKVRSLADLAKKKDKKDDDKDKKEDKDGFGGIAVMGVVLGMFALALKDKINDLVSGAFGGGAIGGAAGKIISDALPGAILGFAVGGVKGIVPGAFLSLAGNFIYDKIDTIQRMINGEPPKEVGPLSGDMLEGAIVGGVLGFKAGGPAGIIPGAVIGALSGLVFNAINSARAEEEKHKKNEEESLKQIDKAKAEGKTFSTESAIQSVADKLEAKEASGEKLTEIEKNLVDQSKQTKEEVSDYEKERAKAEKEAMKKYGKSLSELTLDEKNDVMWDNDAGFEDYLYKLEKEGKITNDAETRALLKPIWDKSQGFMDRSAAYSGDDTSMWGSVKGLTGALLSNSWFSDNYTMSQEAVAAAIANHYRMDTQAAPTTEEIHSDTVVSSNNDMKKQVVNAIKDNEKKGDTSVNAPTIYNNYSTTQVLNGGGQSN